MVNNYTMVDANGRVLRQGTGGVVIVPEGTDIPMLVVTEVSDDTVFNLFLTTPANSSGVIASQLPGEDKQFEVLLNVE